LFAYGDTGWETDVVSDYLAAPCYKVVCTDPNDQIICDGASLKVVEKALPVDTACLCHWRILITPQL